jgi:hypothetical protein
MPHYYARSLAVLTVPVAGTSTEKDAQEKSTAAVSFPVRVQCAALESNDHNHADTLKLSVEWRDAGVDPRILSSATCDFYIGQTGNDGRWRPSRADLRFVGIATRIARIAQVDEGFHVEIEFHDYTRFFLKAKPFGTSGIPDYSQTLDEAWRRIVSQTPGADALAGRLRLLGLSSYPTLATAVASRFATLGKVPTKPGTDAWAVWQQCVGMLGLISYVRLDEVIVTTATDYYTAKDPPRLIWGRNLLALSESRDCERAERGVGITSFDPLTGTTLEALWPPVGDDRVKRKRVAAKKAQDETALRQGEERDYFAYPEVTNPDALLEIAKRVYEERSRQELEGSLRTTEMRVDTLGGQGFDLLTLAAGDVIRVEFEQADKERVAALPSKKDRVDYLIARGYSDDAADLTARSVEDIGKLAPNFFVKRVHTTLVSDDDAGDFTIEVTFCNRIQIDGAARAS